MSTSVYNEALAQLYGTPQAAPIPGREAEMVPNNAGGYGFALDKWQRLLRFLILGSEGGTYYVRPRELTEQNIVCAMECIAEDGVRTVRAALAVNLANLAPKVDASLLVLALAVKHGDQATKNAATVAAGKMLRTGTHMLTMCRYFDAMGGWNRTKRRIIANWFAEPDTSALAFQAVKYQSRDRWSQRDALRVSHPIAATPMHGAVFDVICGRASRVLRDAIPPVMQAWLQLRAAMPAAEGDTIGDTLPLHQARVVECALTGIAAGLPREALPTEALRDAKVWRALLATMPPHALLRNLGTMSAAGVFGPDYDGLASARAVAATLSDTNRLRRARVHPFALLLAALVYRTGTGVRSRKAWSVDQLVLDALYLAYESLFAGVQPIDNRVLVAIDVSGSMTMPEHAICAGTPILAATAALAVAATLRKLMPNARLVTFDRAVLAELTGEFDLRSVDRLPVGGGTDVAAPARWATLNNERFDAFVILTDDETWAGSMHPQQALDAYRRHVNPAAQLICCSMAANHANVADPTDTRTFSCVGLDANLPALVTDIIRGEWTMPDLPNLPGAALPPLTEDDGEDAG